MSRESEIDRKLDEIISRVVDNNGLTQEDDAEYQHLVAERVRLMQPRYATQHQLRSMYNRR